MKKKMEKLYAMTYKVNTQEHGLTENNKVTHERSIMFNGKTYGSVVFLVHKKKISKREVSFGIGPHKCTSICG